MRFEKSVLTTATPAALNVILAILALLVVFSFGIRTISVDTWWTNLANGRLMSQQGGVPREDQLTFSRAGTETVDASWLYDRTMYSLWNSVGPAGVTIIHALTVVLAFLILTPLARRWSNFPAIALSLMLCGWLLSFRFNISAATLTLIFPAIFLSLLYSRVRPVYLWIILPLSQWLWANMFSSFLLGPVLVLLMAAQAHFNRNDKKFGYHSSGVYAGMAGLCLLVTLINPYGIKLYRHVFSLWSNPALAYVNEWVSPFASHFSSGLPSMLLVATLLIGAVGLITYRDRLPIMLTVIVGLAAFFSVRSLRFIELLSILAFPFICLATQAILDAVAGLDRGATGKGKRVAEFGTAGLAVLIGLLSLWQITSDRYYSRTGSGSSFGLGLQDSSLPVAASSVVARPDFPKRAVNLPVDGGYLSWSLPERRIFIDKRSVLFGYELYQSLNQAMLGDEEAWKKLQQNYDFDAVILPCSITKGGMMFNNMASKQDWKLIFFDGLNAIFIRSKAEYAQILSDPELRPYGISLLQNEYDRYAESIAQGGRQPNSARLIGAGNVFYATGRLKGACSIFDLTQQGSPNMSGAWLVAGIARARLGEDHERAAQMLRRACELNPELALGWIWLSYSLDRLGNLSEALTAYGRGLELDPDLGKDFMRPGTRK